MLAFETQLRIPRPVSLSVNLRFFVQGLGSPVFNKLEAELGRACLSLPATKGFEIGSGFEGAKMTGSEHNDEFYRADDGEIRTRTNRSGGVQGGISNGEVIYVKVAFKPTSTITVSGSRRPFRRPVKKVFPGEQRFA